MLNDFRRSLIKAYYGLRLGKPRLIYKVGKSLVRGKLLGQVPLKYLDIAFDYGCNFRCDHCFAQSLKKDGKSRELMTLDDYRKLYREASELGALDFNFQGGEPLLFMDRLEKIIKVFRPRENFISVTTNAYLMDEKKLARLKDMGVDMLVLSIDSYLPEEHDKFRKAKGALERALKTVDMSLEKGMNVAINTTVWHGNVRSEGLKKLIDYVERKGVFMNPIFAAPSGRWKDNLSVILTEEDIEYISRIIDRKWFMRRDVQANLIRPGCGAVKESLYVTAYGDVLGCPFIHVSFGNVKDEPLKVIRERGLGTKYFGKYWPRCLISEEREFMKSYLEKLRGKKLPADFSGFKDVWK